MSTRIPKVVKGSFVASAWKLGCAGGYDAVKIRAIAEDAGVSGALIYSYYEDKAALMDELRRVGAELLEARLTEELASTAPAPLLRLTSRYIAYMREHAWLYHGPSKVDLNGPEVEHAQAFIRRAAGLLGPAERDQGDRQPRAHILAVHLWLALRGVILVPLRSMILDQTFVDMHAGFCVRGVAPDDARVVTYPTSDAAAGAVHVVG